MHNVNDGLIFTYNKCFSISFKSIASGDICSDSVPIVNFCLWKYIYEWMAECRIALANVSKIIPFPVVFSEMTVIWPVQIKFCIIWWLAKVFKVAIK